MPKSVARPDVRANPAAGAQANAQPRHRVRRRALVGLLAGALLMVPLTACDSSGDGSTELRVAEAKVTAKQQAFTDAQADLKSKSDDFCDASADYLTALDRYGDVITQTAPTVGDVTDAGADLEQPQDDVMSGADAAVAAQQAVSDAEQELANAEAALAELKHPGSTAATAPVKPGTLAPLAPEAAVNRVQLAESQLDAVQQGINDRTPLAQASQQFNAAVVALEMAWLRLFSDAGCIADDQQKEAEQAVHDYTTTLQTSLHDAGYYDGEVDGIYGPATVDAVEALQKAHGLTTTGTVDKATAAALQNDLAAKGGAIAQQSAASTAAVQQTLKLAGFWDGPVDGEWTPALTEALQRFQAELGVKPTGTVDAATLAAFEKAIAEAQEPTPTTAPTTSPPSSPATITPSSSLSTDTPTDTPSSSSPATSTASR